MVYQAEERTKVRRQRTELAIQLAMQGRWDEAAAVNRQLISVFPTDVDAYNRLGKALTELGQYGEAREAYSKALELDPHNSIARKNLSRLASLGEEEAPRPEGTPKLSPQMFIEEMGKTGVTTLLRPNLELALRMTAGDQVFLRPQDGALVVETRQGEYLGEVEPRLAQRLLKLMEGGNQYVAAVTAFSDTDIRVFIRETFQHPSQAGKLSFPPTVTEAFRPYVKERLLRKDVEEEEFFEEGDDEWESPAESQEGSDVTLYQFPTAASQEKEEEEPGEE